MSDKVLNGGIGNYKYIWHSNDLLTELNEIIGDALALQSEILSGINFFTNVLITKKCSRTSLAIIESCIDALQQILGALNDFLHNYNDMKEADTKRADKYFHSKANCEGAQRGEFGELVAKAIGDLRELIDLYRNILEKGYSLKLTLEDKEADLEANRYGREQGKNNSGGDSGVLVDIYRPNGLPDKY